MIGKDGNPKQQRVQDVAALGFMMQGIAQQNIQQNTPQQPTQHQEESVVDKLKKLKEIYDLGLIEDTEYQSKKPDKKSYPAFLNYLIYYFNIILSAPS